MKAKYILSGLCVLASLGTVNAQSLSEIMRISEYNTSFGTARTAAMGGAYTSLGADASSVDINPAGIAMYRRSEISLSPSINIISTTSNAIEPTGSLLSEKENRTRFNINNVSAMLHTPVYGNTLTGITFGLSYNRTADYYMSSYSQSAPTSRSISDLFIHQLNGIPPQDIDFSSTSRYNDFSSGLWGAIMNFNNYMLEATEDGQYFIEESRLALSDRIIPAQNRTTAGGVSTFAFSAGLNFNDIIYAGLSLGGRFFNYYQSIVYHEYAAQGNIGDFNRLYYPANLGMSGSSFDFKVGITAQPLDGLRIGVAYHAPTTTNIYESYSESQTVFYNTQTNSRYQSDGGFIENEYRVVSASRLLTGISYRIGSRAIVSFDYTYNINRSAKVKDLPELPGDGGLNYMIRNFVQNSHDFKVGAEVMVIDGLFLRAGYAQYGKIYKDIADKYGTTRNISGGIGYASNHFAIDLAYINVFNRVEPYKYFGDVFNGQEIAATSEIHQRISKNMITATFSFRF